MQIIEVRKKTNVELKNWTIEKIVGGQEICVTGGEECQGGGVEII